MKVIYLCNIRVEREGGINSFSAKVDFSRRPRKAPKSTIVTILIKSLLKLLGAVAIYNFW